MRGLAIAVIITTVCISTESNAQVNYRLFPGRMSSTPESKYIEQHATAQAIVLSFRNSSVYYCEGDVNRKDNNIKLICRKNTKFNGTLMSGDLVTTQTNRGPELNFGGDLVFNGTGFWQLDQAAGEIQFCLFDPPALGVSSSCAGTKVEN
jgi:hypothetical protein